MLVKEVESVCRQRLPLGFGYGDCRLVKMAGQRTKASGFLRNGGQ